jgi:hypothetical protein
VKRNETCRLQEAFAKGKVTLFITDRLDSVGESVHDKTARFKQQVGFEEPRIRSDPPILGAHQDLAFQRVIYLEPYYVSHTFDAEWPADRLVLRRLEEDCEENNRSGEAPRMMFPDGHRRLTGCPSGAINFTFGK